MFNDWFSIGPFTVHGYGVMIAIGILAAFYVAEKLADKNGLSKSHVDNLVFTVLISGYLVSKLTYVLVNFEAFLKDPMSVLGSSGWVVMGGLIGGILGAYVYSKINKIDFFAYFNLFMPSVALAQAFGRIGCFFAGCCYGAETTSKFSLVFPKGSLAPSGVHLIPTQLISSFGDFVLFIILYKIYTNEDTKKETSAWYLILYSIGRFLVEFLRGDIERGTIGNLSTSQFLSVFTLLIGVIYLIKIRKNKVGNKK